MNKLASEKVVVEAPMSFTGSAKRLWRLTDNEPVRWLIILPIIMSVWMVIACWYAMFGLLLVPYRLLRRGSRKRKLAALQHRELLAAVRQ